MRSRLRPDSATTVGLLTAAGVFLIYQNATPSLADIRSAEPHDSDAETARRHAAWMSAALVTGVFLVARDFNSFIISGGALVALDFAHKHANTIHPATGRPDVDTAPSIASVHPMPEYADA